MLVDEIVSEVDAQGVATVTIDRPEKRNALSLAMWRALAATFTELGTRDDVRVIILTGAGGHFCAGADISEFAQVRSTIEAGRVYEAANEAAALAIRDCPRATIAAVSGYGLGGGCGIALACDLRVGDATTRMGIPAALLGNVYGTLDTDLLRRQVGLANAKLVLYSGRQFALEACLAMGLVDQAGPQPALTTAQSLAAEIAGNAPISIMGAKLVLEALEQGQTAARKHDIERMMDRALTSEDYRDAARAFVDKRKPVFKGR